VKLADYYRGWATYARRSAATPKRPAFGAASQPPPIIGARRRSAAASPRR